MKKIIVPAILIAAVAALIIFGGKSISTEIVIEAPVERVWSHFTDFKSYPEWNPFILKVKGEVKTGNRIEATLKIPGKEPMVFTPVVLAFQRNSILQWEGMLLLPGVFTGRHTFRFESLGPRRTRLVQEEDFRGILVPFFGLDATREGFTLMNRALKARIEEGRP